MIKIAIIPEDHAKTDFVQNIQTIKELKITGIINPDDEQGQTAGLEGLLDKSEAVYIEKPKAPVNEALKFYLRKSSHIFIKNPFISSLSSILHLINFQQEAGSIIQVYNPFFFHSDILKIKDKLESPLSLDIEVTTKDNSKLEQELLKTLLFLSGAEKSDFRKLEVFGLQGEKQSLINLHFQFVSGSVAQLKFHTRQSNQPKCRINIYQKEAAPLQLEMRPSAGQLEKSEQNALKQFVKAIKQQDGALLTLNELHQALHALNEIKEKLKYPNIRL